MAEAIAAGIKAEDPEIVVKLYNAGRTDKNDIITEVFKSKALLVGSPTINKGVLTSIAAILEEIRGLEFKNKKAAAFGCYGWSGESAKMIGRLLEECGLELVDDGIRALWNPDEDSIAQCVEYGRKFAAAL